MPAPLTADALIALMREHASPTEAQGAEARMTDPDTKVIGVRMKTIFDAATASKAMPLDEVDQLLDSDFHEARMAAVSILDFQVRSTRVPDEERRDRYEL